MRNSQNLKDVPILTIMGFEGLAIVKIISADLRYN